MNAKGTEKGRLNQRLVIDEALIEEFAELEAVQFDHCNPWHI